MNKLLINVDFLKSTAALLSSYQNLHFRGWLLLSVSTVVRYVVMISLPVYIKTGLIYIYLQQRAYLFAKSSGLVCNVVNKLAKKSPLVSILEMPWTISECWFMLFIVDFSVLLPASQNLVCWLLFLILSTPLSLLITIHIEFYKG